ncbi:MAG: hypothetical protein ACI9XB_001099 [Gammaproteobacteria bacterium]|jgi:hypothetical protein
MTLEQLEKDLTAAITSGNQLTLNGTLLQSPEIGTILSEYFDKGDIVISSAMVKLDSTANCVTVPGKIDYQQLKDCDINATLTINGSGNVVMVLPITLTDGWKMTEVFTDLKYAFIEAVQITGASLLLNTGSAAYTDPTYHIDLPKGLNLVGSLSVTSSVPEIAPLFSATPTLAISGAITVDGGFTFFKISTVKTDTKIINTDLKDIQLAFLVKNIAESGDPIMLAEGEISGILPLGESGEGSLSASVASSSLVNFSADFTDVTLTDLTDLVPFIGSADILKSLPEDVQKKINTIGSAFQLTNVGLQANLSPLSLLSTSVAITVNLKGFQIFQLIPDIAIQEIDFSFDVTFAKEDIIGFSAKAKIQIGTTYFVWLAFQTQPENGYILSVKQDESKPLNLNDALSTFIPGLTGFPKIEVEGFNAIINPNQTTYECVAQLKTNWTILDDPKIILQEVKLAANYYGKSNITGYLKGFFELVVDPTDSTKNVQLFADVEKTDTGWSFGGYSAAGYMIPVGDFIQSLVHTLSSTADVPKVIADLNISDLNLRFSTAGAGNSTFTFHLSISDKICDKEVEFIIDVDVERQAGNYQNSFGLGLIVGSVIFHGTLSTSSTDKQFSISWAETNGGTLSFQDIASTFGFTIPDIPKELDLGLKSATLEYDITKEILLIAASSSNYGNAVFVGYKNKTTKKWQFFFGLAIDKKLDLSNLPIIGQEIAKVGTVAIDHIQVNLTSIPFDKDTATDINSMIDSLGGSYPKVSAKGETEKFSFSVTLDVGGITFPISVGADEGNGKNGNDGNRKQNDTLTLVPSNSSKNQIPTPASKAVWINLQKSFGPLYIEKIGLAYQDSHIYVLLNISGTIDVLTISLEGLGAGFKLDSFNHKFTISGIGITYESGPVLVSGGLMGSFDPVNLVGEIMVKVETLSIGALGGYTTIDGHPSMFLFAVLDYPIGGPAFFFITGLSGGFGYNRKLLIPPVTGVSTFPFVEWAQGLNNPPSSASGGNIVEEVNKVLEDLSEKGIVAPQLDSNWLAAGIKFTSFEMLNSIAILTVVFGTDFEIALLGDTQLVVPVGANLPGSEVPIVAFIELQLEASFSTKSDLLAIEGQLTSSSYVLSPDCHITGGFAFYFWFGGEHEGDFVVTLGGYNQSFSKPSFFPVVPRLGLNWQVVPELSIKGGEYFALTNNAVMAGGYLQAVWKSGPIKAWFDVQADFLIMWKPFHYDIRASVDIGASFTIKLLFVRVSVTIHVGVSLHIWGPNFAGTARVHISIISFTVAFGDSSQGKPETISWDDFALKMIPQKQSSNNGLTDEVADTLTDTLKANPDVLKIVALDGKLKELSNKGGELNWVVNGEKFQFTTQGTIPSKSWTFSSNVTLAPDEDQPTANNNTDFGVRPVGVAHNDFTSNHKITITSTEDSTFQAVRQQKSVPKAMWEKISFNNGTPQMGDPLNNTTIPDVLDGFLIIPWVDIPASTLWIELTYLQYTIDPKLQQWVWGIPYVIKHDPFSDETVSGTIMEGSTQTNRNKLFDAISTLGFYINPHIDVTELASATLNDLLSEPEMRLLGEEKIT